MSFLDRHKDLLPKTGRVLEVGCGNEMQFKQWFEAQGTGYTWDGLTPGVKAPDINDGFVENLTNEDHFSIIFGCHVFEHCVNIVQALKACHKALKANGVLLMATPIYHESQIITNQADQDHIMVLTEMQWMKLCRFAGFSDENIKTWQTGTHEREDSIVTWARK